MYDRQGLKWQLVAAGYFDDWLAEATGGSFLPDMFGNEDRKTTTAKSPVACKKKKR